MNRKNYSSKNYHKRKPFKLNIRELTPEDTDPDLGKVQTLLARLSYFSETYEPERLDKPTQTALKKYQAFHGLKQTGTTDRQTVMTLEQPRCGTPDPTEDLQLEAMAEGEFVLSEASLIRSADCKLLNLDSVTYMIASTPDELPQSDQLNFNQVKGAIEAALATWEALIPITFVSAQDDLDATFKFRWVEFDNIGGLFARGFYPGNCGGDLRGQCHFDKAETWGLVDLGDEETFNLQAVALHEIGHLLGLKHSLDGSSIMSIRPSKTLITIEETDPAHKAIQDFYGEP